MLTNRNSDRKNKSIALDQVLVVREIHLIHPVRLHTRHNIKH